MLGIPQEKSEDRLIPQQMCPNHPWYFQSTTMYPTYHITGSEGEMG